MQELVNLNFCFATQTAYISCQNHSTDQGVSVVSLNSFELLLYIYQQHVISDKWAGKLKFHKLLITVNLKGKILNGNMSWDQTKN